MQEAHRLVGVLHGLCVPRHRGEAEAQIADLCRLEARPEHGIFDDGQAADTPSRRLEDGQRRDHEDTLRGRPPTEVRLGGPIREDVHHAVGT